MTRRFAVLPLAVLAGLLAAASPTRAAAVPLDFFALRERPLMAVVTVDAVQSSLRLLREMGEEFYCSRVAVTLDHVVYGPARLAAGTRMVFSRPEYQAVRPFQERPPLLGRRYLMWADRTSDLERLDLHADWVVERDGLLPIYGAPGQEYVHWRSARLPLADVQARAVAAKSEPLDQVADPAVRNEAAWRQVQRGRIPDMQGLVRGMILVLRDPSGQAKQEAKPVAPDLPVSAAEPPSPTPFELWAASLRVLDGAADTDLGRRKVVAGLRTLLAAAPPRVQVDAALELARLGDASGRRLLHQTLRGAEYDLSEPPPKDGGASISGRFYSNSSRISAAYYLGQIGDPAGLDEKNTRLQFAAVAGLGPRCPQRVRPFVRHFLPQAEKERAAALKAGRPDWINAETGEPSYWLLCQVALAAEGDAASLDRLVRDYVKAAGPRGSPSAAAVLRGAIDKAVARPALAARLQPLTKDATLRQSPAFEALLKPPPRPAKSRFRLPSEEQLRKALQERLDSKDANQRARALMYAGHYAVDALYPTVLETATQKLGVERLAAIRALGYYGRSLSSAIVGRLLQEGEPESRELALDVISGIQPVESSDACLAAISDLIKHPPAGESELAAGEREGHLLLILSRLLPAGVPSSFAAGLKDADLRVRTVFVKAAALSGNPAVVDLLRPLVHDTHPEISRFAAWAVRALPWK